MRFLTFREGNPTYLELEQMSDAELDLAVQHNSYLPFDSPVTTYRIVPAELIREQIKRRAAQTTGPALREG